MAAQFTQAVIGRLREIDAITFGREPRVTAGRPQESENRMGQRRFSAAAFTDKPHCLARSDLQRDLLDGAHDPPAVARTPCARESEPARFRDQAAGSSHSGLCRRSPDSSALHPPPWPAADAASNSPGGRGSVHALGGYGRRLPFPAGSARENGIRPARRSVRAPAPQCWARAPRARFAPREYWQKGPAYRDVPALQKSVQRTRFR